MRPSHFNSSGNEQTNKYINKTTHYDNLRIFIRHSLLPLMYSRMYSTFTFITLNILVSIIITLVNHINFKHLDVFFWMKQTVYIFLAKSWAHLSSHEIAAKKTVIYLPLCQRSNNTYFSDLIHSSFKNLHKIHRKWPIVIHRLIANDALFQKGK